MNENEFGYRIRQALNEGADCLDYKTAYRLEQARAKAVAALRGAPSFGWRPALLPACGSSLGDEGSAGWAQRLGLAAPLRHLAVAAADCGLEQPLHSLQETLPQLLSRLCPIPGSCSVAEAAEQSS